MKTPDELAEEPSIRLDQFLKLIGLTATGGQAKLLIQDGEVNVNDEVETRRRRKLAPGDRVAVRGEVFELNDFLADDEAS